MSKTSAKQKHETLQEWLGWFNAKYNRKKGKQSNQDEVQDKSFRVDIKGFK